MELMVDGERRWREGADGRGGRWRGGAAGRWREGAAGRFDGERELLLDWAMKERGRSCWAMKERGRGLEVEFYLFDFRYAVVRALLNSLQYKKLFKTIKRSADGVAEIEIVILNL
jgi:hypothetical protein